MTKALAVKDEIRSGARNFKARTLQDVPSQHTPDDDLEIPAANLFTMLAIDRDELRATSFVAFATYYLIQPRADVGARIALQSSQQICARDHVGPRRVRAAGAILVAHAGQVLRWPRAPERGDVRGFAAARRAEVRVDELAAIVGEHLAFSRANRGRNPTVSEGAHLRILTFPDRPTPAGPPGRGPRGRVCS